MPGYLSWINHADSATLSTTTSGTMLRPLTQLQVPFAKGLCRGPENGTISVPAYLNIRADLGENKPIHYIGLVGMNGTYTTGVLDASTVSAGADDVLSGVGMEFNPFYVGPTDPLGASLWWQGIDLEDPIFARYIEINVEVYNLPGGQRYVDARRLLVMAGGGVPRGFDRGWSILPQDTSLVTRTPKGGIYLTEEQTTRKMQFSITGRDISEMRQNTLEDDNFDCLERVLTGAGKRKEIVVCPRNYNFDYDEIQRNTIYGMLEEWGPITHAGGQNYSCENIVVHEIPHPPL